MTTSPFPSRPLGPVQLVEDDAGLRSLLSRLRGSPLLAVDTEAASFHRYLDRVYLLQLSSRDVTAVVDPLATSSLAAFGELLADPAIEVVFHDADYDLRLLEREFGFRATHLFDTRVAAQLLNEPGIGLAALLEKYLGVTLDKRFQRADWSARPLTEPMLRYAASDTHHLPELRDILRGRLEAMGRLAWAEEEFALLEKVEWSTAEPEAPWLRMKGAKALRPRQLAILRELYQWRDATARRLDRAAFRIINNEPMLAMAIDPPATLAALGQVRGVGRDLFERRGNEVLAALERARAIPDADLPQRIRPPRRVADPAYEERLDRLKAVRNSEAMRIGLAPGILAPNGILEGIARLGPGTTDLSGVEGMRGWQRELVGETLLAAARNP
jgi:ribonuclease D